MLGTDKAWEVFEALEDNYFDKPVYGYGALPPQQPQPFSEMTDDTKLQLLNAMIV